MDFKTQLISFVIVFSLSIVGYTQEIKPKPCAKRPLKSRIVVDISEQKLYLFCTYNKYQPEEMKVYPVSTSKNAPSNRAGSGGTPLGKHYIKQKIGYRAPKGMIFKARRSTGRIAIMNRRGAGDLVTTRIMWLKGKEWGKNLGGRIDSFRRYIYIHGTAEENKIGTPASHGCIRMKNPDVIDLFNKVQVGTNVYIRK